MGRRTIKRGPGRRPIEGKDFQLADEIRYIRRRAAEHDHLAARLARDGDPEDVHFEETEARFAIGWKGKYRIDGEAFVYTDRDSGRVVTILGYPVRRIAEWGDREISNMFG